MCDPVSISIIGGSMAGKAVSAYQETEAENKALEYNASIAEQNAANLEKQQDQANFVGSVQQGKIFQGARRLKGTQQSAIASAGVRVGTGSAADILTGTQDIATADALTVRYNTQQQIKNLGIQKTNQLESAKFSRASKQDPSSKAALSLLTEAPKLAQKYNFGSSSGGKK